ncbi:MAG: hypothetical protein IJZ92_03470 [Bacteroidaceae bacterium]|nr:hypothetical protein [Bacteroidaceae bacterium]
MKYIRILFFLLAVAFVGMQSACSSDDVVDASDYGDCIVTAARIGTLTRDVKTKTSEGKDTVYSVTVQGYYYPLSIDHINGRIYNADSLPVGTRTDKTVFSAFSGTGRLAIRSLVTGEDSTLTLADSLDFSRERFVTVYAYDGIGSRTYSVNLRVHREEADSFRWARVHGGEAALAALTDTRLVRMGTRLLAYGRMDADVCVAVADVAHPTTWNTIDLSATGLNPRSVMQIEQRLYALGNEGLLSSADGMVWSLVETDFRPEALVAAGSQTLYAQSGGTIYASTDGVEWVAEDVDEPAEWPTGNFVSAHQLSRTDKHLENILMVGSSEGGAKVWKRVVDLTGRENFSWFFLPVEDKNPYPCPNLQNAALMTYDEGSLLAGTTADGRHMLYQSSDNGRTWIPGAIAFPTALTGTMVAATTDADNFVWVVCSGSGDVWRGRLNRLGWVSR